MKKPVTHSDPEILGGTRVFAGTRVPVQTLIDYLEAGETLDAFLDSFPSGIPRASDRGLGAGARGSDEPCASCLTNRSPIRPLSPAASRRLTDCALFRRPGAPYR